MKPQLETPAERLKFKRWVLAETHKLEDQEEMLNLLLREQILKAWKAYHPQMLARLATMNLAEKFADLMQAKMWEAQESYSKAGMPWPDSQEQAEREWLMMYPEEDLATTT